MMVDVAISLDGRLRYTITSTPKRWQTQRNSSLQDGLQNGAQSELSEDLSDN